MNFRLVALAAVASLNLLVAACGGGGGMSSSQSAPTSTGGASANALSTGAITAFGSVFVNGHEFDVSKATVMDDDTGQSASPSSAGLEVGQVVDVQAAGDSSDDAPVAAVLHMHPLVRGYVDASDTNALTLTVMGQTVQLGSGTLFSDHRACVQAASNPCAAVAGQSGLSATTGSGASAVPGTYVRIDGYLFDGGSAATNIVATLVAVFDESDFANDPRAFKVEGPVSTMGSGTIGIGGLTVTTTDARCYPGWADFVTTTCSLRTGEVVSAMSATPPVLPASAFTAEVVVARSHLPVETPGATVELQGSVSAVTSSPAGFTLRGIAVDASALPAGTVLPVAGDVVSVVGTVSADGTHVTATSLTIVHAAANASYDFLANFSSVAAGDSANTATLVMFAQTIGVDATTRLADRSSMAWFDNDPASNPFNITTFVTFLQASSSKHLLVRTSADASGNLHALSVTLLPASGLTGVSGVVDATPAPVDSTTTGTPTTFAIHGVAISADPAAIVFEHETSSIAAGDAVTAVGAYASGTLTVGAQPSGHNYVLDRGVPRHHDDGGDGF